MKRWSRASSVGALILVAAVTATAAPAGAAGVPAQASAAPRDEVTIVAPQPVGLETGTWTAPSTTVQESAIQWVAGSNEISLDWQDLVRLTQRAYPTTTAPAEPGRPQLSLAGRSTCGSGTLVVHEVAYALGVDEPVRFAATWQGDCSTKESTVVELRHNSGTDSVRLGSARVGQDLPTRRIPFSIGLAGYGGDVQWHGDLTARVTADTCRGRSFQRGESCYLDVVARPTEASASFLALSLRSQSGEILATTSVSLLGTETSEGSYTPLKTPRRLLDTRTTKTPLQGGQARDVQVTNALGMSSTAVSAVVVNITVVSPTVSGNLAAYPAGATPPKTSSVNFNKGWTGANLVAVRPGAGTVAGKIRLLSSGGSTHVIVDVVGYYRTAAGWTTTSGAFGSFQTLKPFRLYDSRQHVKVRSNEVLTLVTDFGHDDNPRIKALAVNLTVVSPEAAGHLVAWDGANDGSEAPTPNVSNLNFTTGRTVPNMAIVPVRPCWLCAGDAFDKPGFTLANQSTKPAHVIIDVVGVFDDNTREQGARFRVLATPARILDTRSGLGFQTLGSGATGTGSAQSVSTWATTALSGNLTAAAPAQSTVLTAWAADQPRPGVSSMNPYAGQYVSNMTMPGVSGDKKYSVHSSGMGTANVVLDVAGTFEQYRRNFPIAVGMYTGSGSVGGGTPEQVLGR